MVPTLVRALAAFTPFTVSAPAFLRDAVADAGLPVTPDEYAAATTVVTIAATLFAAVLAALVSISASLVIASVLSVGGLVAACALAFPGSLAVRRRARQLGAFPGVVLRAALAMRVTPTLEAGADAVRDDDSVSAATPTHAPPARTLTATATDLPDGAQRAVSLLVAAGDADDPVTLLDRAVTTARDVTRDAANTYAARLHGPVTALYSFGVVLPLALVGVLPALPVAGVRVPLPLLALGLDVVLPVVLLVTLAALLVDRPRTTGTPRVPRDALGSRASVAVAAVTASLSGVLLARLLSAWSVWLLPPAWAVGAALLARYAPGRDALERATGVRDATPDLLVRLGTELAHGAPVERALASAGDGAGTTAALAADATRVRSALGVTVPAALTGADGPLAVLPADERRTLAALLRSASDAGTAGGRALRAYASHLDDLHAVDSALRADLARLTGTLTQTAAVYAPIIGGVTIALATHLRTVSATFAPPGRGIPLVVGGYVLVLAALLPAFATVLVHGPCRVRIGVSVGTALLTAPPLLAAATTAAAALL